MQAKKKIKPPITERTWPVPTPPPPLNPTPTYVTVQFGLHVSFNNWAVVESVACVWIPFP